MPAALVEILQLGANGFGRRFLEARDTHHRDAVTILDTRWLRLDISQSEYRLLGLTTPENLDLDLGPRLIAKNLLDLPQGHAAGRAT
jgi:hypothetical protein